jgi:hypothetical protein
VTVPLPPPARRILSDGVLCHLASATAAGPHLTPVVFVLDGGRLWLTTSRSSAKARAWRHDPRVAGLVRAGDAAVGFRGTVRTYDALDLSTWPSATVGGPRLISAATRFGVKNARFFAGYAVNANRVPFAWTPPGRVFASVRVEGGAVLGANGVVEERWGEADDGPLRAEARFVPSSRRARSLDLGVPTAVRETMGSAGAGTMGVTGSDGRVTVLPVRWRRVGSENRYDAVLAVELAEMSGAASAAPVALTVDRSSWWRASEMRGLLLQGRAELFVPKTARSGRRALAEEIRRVWGETAGPPLALFRLHPDRVVWWDGWTSGTVRR